MVFAQSVQCIDGGDDNVLNNSAHVKSHASFRSGLKKIRAKLLRALKVDMACTVSLTQRPNMQEFYAGKQIFLTGATGFMGKCLLEKLLRSLSGLKRVIVLVRPKKEKTARQRLDELLSSRVSACIAWQREKRGCVTF